MKVSLAWFLFMLWGATAWNLIMEIFMLKIFVIFLANSTIERKIEVALGPVHLYSDSIRKPIQHSSFVPCFPLTFPFFPDSWPHQHVPIFLKKKLIPYQISYEHSRKKALKQDSVGQRRERVTIKNFPLKLTLNEF